MPEISPKGMGEIAMIHHCLDFISNSHGGIKHKPSKLIREFKSWSNHDSIEAAKEILIQKIQSLNPDKETILCAVPSSTGNENSVQKIIPEIAQRLNLIDGASWGITKRIPTQSFCKSRMRDAKVLLHSLKFSFLLADKNVIVLDDLTTTGTSFRVVQLGLFELGAADLQCIALGKTLKLNL